MTSPLSPSLSDPPSSSQRVRLQHIVRSSLLVIFLFGLNKITGFVKLLLMTRTFGTSPAADAFAAANQLPELLQVLLVGGALSAALIPVYAAYLSSSEPAQARILANTVFTLALLVTISICGITMVVAPTLARTLLVPEFVPAQQALTAELMRIILIATVMLGMASVLTSLLHAHQHFFAPALGTVVIDLGQIAGLYFLAPIWGIHGAAWGSVIGTCLLMAVQLPALVRERIRLRLQLALRLPGTREVLRLLGPRMIILGAAQAVDLVIIRLASGLPDGSIAALFYALLVMVAMPGSLFGTAISTVFFPTMSEQFNRGEYGALRTTTTQALRIAWALIIPAAVGLIALGKPAMAFLFQRGSFDADATALVYGLAAILGLRLIGDVTHGILDLAFFARHNTRIPMWVGLGWTVTNIGLSIVLVGPLGVYGLAWASSIAAALQAAAIYLLNWWLLGGLDERSVAQDAVQILLACAGMSIAIIGVGQLNLDTLPYLISAMSLGGTTYGLLYWLSRGRHLWATLRS